MSLVLAISEGRAFAESARMMPHEAPAKDPYEQMMDEERKDADREHFQESIASGVAAVFIGIYGYYNTAPDPLIKLLYAATQTAGVLTISQAIRSQNTPRLMLDLDDLVRQRGGSGTVEVSELKARLNHYRTKAAAADAKTLAYTSSILSGLYFYNGYREQGPDKTLRNIYFFLGFNFAMGGAVGFYRTYAFSRDTFVTVEVLPYPMMTYNF